MLKYFYVVTGIIIVLESGEGRELNRQGNDAPNADTTVAPTTTTTEEETEPPSTTTAKTTTTLKPLKMYSMSVWCKLQKIDYDCDGRGVTLQRFYYDTKLKGCIRGTMTNCASNYNQFRDAKTCHKTCRPYESLDILETNPEVACRLQPEFGNCYTYQPMFYFDVNAAACKGFSYSGCGGNTNRFKTQRDCVNICQHTIKLEPTA